MQRCLHRRSRKEWWTIPKIICQKDSSILPSHSLCPSRLPSRHENVCDTFHLRFGAGACDSDALSEAGMSAEVDMQGLQTLVTTGPHVQALLLGGLNFAQRLLPPGPAQVSDNSAEQRGSHASPSMPSKCLEPLAPTRLQLWLQLWQWKLAVAVVQQLLRLARLDDVAKACPRQCHPFLSAGYADSGQ